MTVNEMVNRETPPKKAAAPINAKAPGSIQFHSVVMYKVPVRSTNIKPQIRPKEAPIINIGTTKPALTADPAHQQAIG
jgi:hypothetical protein